METQRKIGINIFKHLRKARLNLYPEDHSFYARVSPKIIGYNPTPAIPSVNASGNAFWRILYAALTSALMIVPSLTRKRPRCMRRPAYRACRSLDSPSRKLHRLVYPSFTKIVVMPTNAALYWTLLDEDLEGQSDKILVVGYPQVAPLLPEGVVPDDDVTDVLPDVKVHHGAGRLVEDVAQLASPITAEALDPPRGQYAISAYRGGLEMSEALVEKLVHGLGCPSLDGKRGEAGVIRGRHEVYYAQIHAQHASLVQSQVSWLHVINYLDDVARVAWNDPYLLEVRDPDPDRQQTRLFWKVQSTAGDPALLISEKRDTLPALRFIAGRARSAKELLRVLPVRFRRGEIRVPVPCHLL
jgi:hypothetical protein